MLNKILSEKDFESITYFEIFKNKGFVIIDNVKQEINKKDFSCILKGLIKSGLSKYFKSEIKIIDSKNNCISIWTKII